MYKLVYAVTQINFNAHNFSIFLYIQSLQYQLFSINGNNFPGVIELAG